MKQIVGLVGLVRHVGGGRPVGHVTRVGRIVDGLDLFAVYPAPQRDEEVSRRIAGPGVLRSDSADDACYLEARRRRRTGRRSPWARTRHRRSAEPVLSTQMSAIRQQAAVDLVDAERAAAPGEEPEPGGRVGGIRSAAAGAAVSSTGAPITSTASNSATRLTHQNVTSIPSRSRRGSSREVVRPAGRRHRTRRTRGAARRA